MKKVSQSGKTPQNILKIKKKKKKKKKKKSWVGSEKLGTVG